MRRGRFGPFLCGSRPVSTLAHFPRTIRRGLGRRSRVLTRGGDAQGPLDSLQLLRLDEARVRHEAGIQSTFLQVPDDILRPETVAHTPQSLDSQIPSHLLYHGIRHRVDTLRLVTFQPFHQIEACRLILQQHRVAMEQIRHDDQVSVRGELVGDQLGVDDAVAEDVGKEEDGVVGVFVLGVGEVCFGCEIIERPR